MGASLAAGGLVRNLGRIIGIDPGLQHTGWGIIEAERSVMRFVAAGAIHPPKSGALASRLLALHHALYAVLENYAPTQAAIEQTFMTTNGASTLKLGNARGALLLTLAQYGLHVEEYEATLVKKTVVGVGRASKEQVTRMVQHLLPACTANHSHDAYDALAVAITHHHHALIPQTVTHTTYGN
jgi:crossover junction endodeoxyribonuclease RuvC